MAERRHDSGEAESARVYLFLHMYHSRINVGLSTFLTFHVMVTWEKCREIQDRVGTYAEFRSFMLVAFTQEPCITDLSLKVDFLEALAKYAFSISCLIVSKKRKFFEMTI